MRKFDKPFDDYEIAAERPIAIELNPQTGHYKHLIDNPIYYLHAFQYMKGGLYRAIFGYEKLWDLNYERSLTLALDYLLTDHAKKKEYCFEEIVTEKPFTLYGWRWKRGLKPKKLDFRYTWADPLAAGVRATARINLLDKPNHVDIDFHESNEIYSVSYMRYLHWRGRGFIRSLSNEKNTRGQKYTGSKNDQRAEATGLESLGKEDALRAVYDTMPGLRQRFRRSASMQKTHPKVPKHLVSE